MKVSGRMLLILLCACVFCGTTAGYGEQRDADMSYRTEEIWCENRSSRIYGVAYIPEAEGKLPLVIFSHELGNNHEAGVRYAERLAAYRYAAYVFDFCGGSTGGTQNRSDGSNSEMSVLTEASDLSAVLDAAKGWPFVDSDKIFLLGGSQGGLVTIITGCERQDELAGMMLMYPALSAKADSQANSYASPEEVPEDVPLFGDWMHVGRNYITDLWQVDFDQLLASYRGKLLILHGDRDSTVDVSWSEKAVEIIPDCEFHIIPGGGHEFYGQPFEDAIVKYPFWAMTAENPNAVYACLNYDEAVCLEQIRERSICLDGDSGELLKRL